MSPTIPFRRWQLMSVGLCSAAITVVLTLPLLTDPLNPATLRDLADAVRGGLALWALPLGWLMVWAMLPHRADSVVVGAAPARTRGSIVFSQMVQISTAVGVGLAAVLVPVTIALATAEHWTIGDILALLALLVAVCSLIPVAGGVAACVGPRVGLLLTPVSLMAWIFVPPYVINDQLLTNHPVSIMSLCYFWSLTGAGLGEMPVWQTEVLRILFYSLVWLVGCVVAAACARWRVAHRWQTLKPALLWLLPVSVAAVVAVQMPLLYVDDPNEEVRCTRHNGFELCLYPVSEPKRAALIDALTPFIEVLRPSSPWLFTEVSPSPGQAQAIHLAPGRTSVRTAQLDVIWNSTAALMPSALCPEGSEEHLAVLDAAHSELLRRAKPRAKNSVQAIFTQAMSETMASPYSERFTSLTDEAFARWVVSTSPAARTCSLTTKDLP